MSGHRCVTTAKFSPSRNHQIPMRTRCDTMSRPAQFRVSEAAALRVSRLSYTLRRVWPQTYVRHLHAREIRSRACGACTKTRLSRKPAVPRCLDRADGKRAPFSRRSRRFIKLRRPSGERAGFLKYEKPPCELDQASANSGVAGVSEPLSGCVAPMLMGACVGLSLPRRIRRRRRARHRGGPCRWRHAAPGAGSLHRGGCVPVRLLHARIRADDDAAVGRASRPKRRPDPSLPVGNLCRCGAYPQIVEAVNLAARKLRIG